MASNFNAAAAWASREAQKNKGFDGAAAWAERESAKALARTADTTNRMLAGSDIMGRTPATQQAQTTPNGSRVGNALKSIGNTLAGSVVSLAETGAQGVKNTVEELQNDEFTDTQRAIFDAKERLRFLERSKNISAQARKDYDATTAELEQLQAKLDSLQVNTSVGADSLGQKTLQKAAQQKEAALEGTGKVGRWVGENLMSVGQNAVLLPFGLINPAIPLAAMATVSAGSKAAEVNATGAAPGEALIRGAVSGGIEALTEKIPVDNLLDMVKVGGKSAIKNLLKQAGTEAGEESVSYVLNYIADKAAGDPNATFTMKELANAAGSGAFSGGLMGGGATLIGNAVNSSVPSKVNIDNANASGYTNNANGGVVNGSQLHGTPGEGVREGPVSDATGFEMAQGRNDGQGDLRDSGVVLLSDKSKSILTERGVVPVEYSNSMGNAAFSSALDQARNADQKNGWAVSPQSAESLDRYGVKTYLSSNASSGFGVTQDGDIVGVFANKFAGAPKGATVSLIPQAISEGGNKLDCYGEKLVDIYSRFGFVPVARVEFNAEYANPGWTPDKGTPYVYVMMHNGDSADTVVENIGKYQSYTKEQLDSLPTYGKDSYDTAIAYRDDLIERQKSSSKPFVPPIAPRPTPVLPPIFKDGKVVNPDDSVGAAPAGFTGNVERGFSRNLASDQARHEEVQHEYQVNPQMYFRLANKDTLGKATAIMETGLESAKETLEQALGMAKKGYKLNPEMVPLSKMVGDALAAEGRIDEMERILSDVAAELTEAGQLGQAAVILRDTSPSAKIQAIEKAIAKINEEGRKKYGKTWSDLSITEEERAAAAAITPGDEASFEALYDQVAQRIGSEMPATMWEKLSEIRRIAMLLNPKTQIRNVVGNLPLSGMRKVSESISGAIQDRRVKKGKLAPEEQTRTRKVSQESREIASKLFERNKESLSGIADKWDLNGMIRNYRKYFGDSKAGQAADAVREFTYELLEKGDIPFLRSAFVDNAASYIEAQGYTTVEDVPQKVIDFATQQAMEATFKDFSIVASTLNKLKKNGGVGGAALDILFPFTTTPINITKRTAEYSPAGLLSLIGNKKTAAQNIDTIAKSLTGTGVILLGVLLAKWGLATAGTDEKEDKAALDKATGKSPYSFGGRVSYEWMQPIGTQLAMGAEVWEAIENGENPLDAFIDAIIAGGDTILDMTVFSNVKDLFSGYESPSETILETLTSGVASQLTPSLFGAVARSIDPIVRSVSYNEGVIPAAVTGVIAKTPGASKTLPATVNVKGEENRRIENPLLRTAQEMLNPANVNTGTRNKVDDEIYRLYDETGKLSVFPKKAENKVEYDNQTYRLTSEQKQEYQRDLGGTYYDMVSGMMESDIYKNATPEQQAEYLGIAEEYAAAVAKKGVVGDNFEMANKFILSERANEELGISQEDFLMLYKQYGATLMNGDDIREAYASGMDVMSYLDYGSNKPKFNTDGKQGYTTSETSAAINGSGLSKDEQTMLWLIEKPEWGEKAAKYKIAPDIYVEFKEATIGKSKKEDILKAINRMRISKAQKDKLYYAAGYAESKIAEAPWR